MQKSNEYALDIHDTSSSDSETSSNEEYYDKVLSAQQAITAASMPIMNTEFQKYIENPSEYVNRFMESFDVFANYENRQKIKYVTYMRLCEYFQLKDSTYDIHLSTYLQILVSKAMHFTFQNANKILNDLTTLMTQFAVKNLNAKLSDNDIANIKINTIFQQFMNLEEHSREKFGQNSKFERAQENAKLLADTLQNMNEDTNAESKILETINLNNNAKDIIKKIQVVLLSRFILSVKKESDSISDTILRAKIILGLNKMVHFRKIAINIYQDITENPDKNIEDSFYFKNSNDYKKICDDYSWQGLVAQKTTTTFQQKNSL